MSGVLRALGKTSFVLGAAVSMLLGCMTWLRRPDAIANSDPSHEPIRLQNGLYRLPGPEASEVDPGPRLPRSKTSEGRWSALAFHYDAVVYATPDRGARRFGVVRRGTQLSASAPVPGSGCERGWYRLALGGFVCDARGFAVTTKPQPFWIRQPSVDASRALFYDYGRVTVPGALRFVRIPTEREENEIALATSSRSARARLPDVVQARMVGDYFLALDRVETAGKREFYRTVRGRYVRKSDVTLRKPPAMHGVRLGAGTRLPYAFVYGEGDAPLLRARKDGLAKVGVAASHGRFPLRGTRTHRHVRYAMGPGDFAVPLSRVRIARKTARPRSIASDEKWIHVDLDQQVLVAYHGERALFATLISSGKEDAIHATPTGLFRVRDKHLSVTMAGDDPEDGHYEVSEVPWTQFYSGGYALHGAYWHDTFGEPRSHGCTNLAPADARWLFYWTEPHLPDGFHALQRARGTAIYLTRGARVEDEQSTSRDARERKSAS